MGQRTESRPVPGKKDASSILAILAILADGLTNSVPQAILFRIHLCAKGGYSGSARNPPDAFDAGHVLYDYS